MAQGRISKRSVDALHCATGRRVRPVDGEDKKKATAARKKAFERGEKEALAAGLIQFDEADAKKFVWLSNPMEREAASAMAPRAAAPPIITISNAFIVDDPPPRYPGPVSQRQMGRSDPKRSYFVCRRLRKCSATGVEKRNSPANSASFL